jgi:repressor LexA
MPAVTAPHGLCLLAPIHGLGADWESAVAVEMQPVREDLRPALTDRQQRIVAFVAEFNGRHGYSPSLREIGAAVGLVTPSSVRHQLHALASKGYLVLPEQARQPRSLRLVQGVA